MMNQINCSVCGLVLGYTNRTIPMPKSDFLTSEKLSINQKWATKQRMKLIYCPACYEKGIEDARKEQQGT